MHQALEELYLKIIQTIQIKNYMCYNLQIEYSLDKLTMNMSKMYTKLKCYVI